MSYQMLSSFGARLPPLGVLEAMSGIEYAPNWQQTGYTGLDAAGDAVVSEIMAQGGSTSPDALQAYAAAAGGAGAGAACAAYGAAAAVPACVAVGSAIAKMVTGGIGKPASSGNALNEADAWNDYVVPVVKIANEGVMAIRAYLTTRDALLTSAANSLNWKDRSAALAWANIWLKDHGCPAAPLNQLWNPDWYPGRWEAFKKFAIRAEDPTVWKGTPPYNQPEYGAGISCALASQLKLTCATYRTLKAYPSGLPAPPGAPVDWGIIGAFQYLMAAPQPPSKGYSNKLCCDQLGTYRMEYLYFPMPNIANCSSFSGGIVGAPGSLKSSHTYAAGVDAYVKKCQVLFIEANMIPSQKAIEWSLALQEATPKLMTATKSAIRSASANMTLAHVLAMEKEKSEKMGIVGKTALVGGAGLGLWWLWRTFMR
jgi:hypothetical protein